MAQQHLDEDDFITGWEDIVPIPQDDGPNPVVMIAYPSQYVHLMDLFRGVAVKGEYSERVLKLTAAILELNNSSYTVWLYRRDCLRAINYDLHLELNYMDSFAAENPKSYQIWHHRRVIVEILRDGQRELDFCRSVIDIDNKNYHAWAHRQWIIKTFHLWDNELSYIEEMIEIDIRNNSAWNQRWFYVHYGPFPVDTDIILREIEYAFKSIIKVKLNESSWNYLRGLYNKYSQHKIEIKSRISELVNSSEKDNPLALGLLADIMENDEGVTHWKEAENILLHLIEVDKIRSKSWMRRLENIRKKLDTHTTSIVPQTSIG